MLGDHAALVKASSIGCTNLNETRQKDHLLTCMGKRSEPQRHKHTCITRAVMYMTCLCNTVLPLYPDSLRLCLCLYAIRRRHTGVSSSISINGARARLPGPYTLQPQHPKSQPGTVNPLLGGSGVAISGVISYKYTYPAHSYPVNLQIRIQNSRQP